MELKPCPFCGGKAETDFAYYDYNFNGVHCTVCGAYVCDMDNAEKAVALWNSRVGEGEKE